MLELDLLRSFVSVVDTGGFTRAGERVHRTQSTVSQQIKRLEETLGYPLLHRDGKQATPTEQGERLVSYARRLLALEREARNGGPKRRLVGLQLTWDDIDGLFNAQGLPPAISPTTDRSHVPVWGDGGRQVGKATSHGWSPILKQAIALASVAPAFERPGTRLQVEWTVEGRRGRVNATVVELPFLDLDRKRA